MYIIPAIDILNGKVVGLCEDDYEALNFTELSLYETIKKYQSNGTEFIHIIDLNAKEGDFSNQKHLFELIKKAGIKIQYGGIVSSIKKIKELASTGIHRILVNTVINSEPEYLRELSEEMCGRNKCSDQVVIVLEGLTEPDKHLISIENPPIELTDQVDRCLDLGFFRFLYINRCGKLNNLNIELYQKLLNHSPFIKLIASGGISCMGDVETLQKIKLESCIVGKAIDENRISINEVKAWNLKALISL